MNKRKARLLSTGVVASVLYAAAGATFVCLRIGKGIARPQLVRGALTPLHVNT